MGLRRRLGWLLRARARRLQGSEDPIAALELAYSRELAIADAIRQGIAGVVTARTRLRLQRQSLERERPRQEESARGHLREGRDHLAAAALTQAELIGGQVEALAGQEQHLDGDLRRSRPRRAATRPGWRCCAPRRRRSAPSTPPTGRGWAPRWRSPGWEPRTPPSASSSSAAGSACSRCRPAPTRSPR